MPYVKMAFQYLLRAYLLLFPFQANGQVGTPYPYFAPLESGSTDSVSTCLAQYKEANASGTFSWGPSFVNGDTGGIDGVGDLSWTVTVSENTTSGEFSSDLWLGTPPGMWSPFPGLRQQLIHKRRCFQLWNSSFQWLRILHGRSVREPYSKSCPWRAK
jgi:hypothetical protein